VTDWHAKQAQAHYHRQVRWKRFVRWLGNEWPVLLLLVLYAAIVYSILEGK